MSTLADLIAQKPEITTVAVTDGQFGDTGKGKIVDELAEGWAKYVVRANGGANAGHTIIVEGRKVVLHLIPAGILHPNVVNVIGTGVAFDPRAFSAELKELTQVAMPSEPLVSHRARLVLPLHILLDRLREAGPDGSLGITGRTTGMGIGPCYTDHVARCGLVVNDLFNPDELARKLRENLAGKMPILREADPELIKAILLRPELNAGEYFTTSRNSCHLDLDAVITSYREYAKDIAVSDTDVIVRAARGSGLRILLEGAQGLMLDLNHGRYPYVTCSDCTVDGLARGAGLAGEDVDLPLTIFKAPYMTCVGLGSFPTEIEGPEGEAIRTAGNEYGATTGRPRRVGWFDLPLARYAKDRSKRRRPVVRHAIFTKLDVLTGIELIKICKEYEYIGPDYNLAGKGIRKGARLNTAIPDEFILNQCQPIYTEFPGWETSPSSAKVRGDLPRRLEEIINVIEVESGFMPLAASVGPERDQTVILNEICL